MDYFSLNKEFDSYEALIETKKAYENATNNLLVIVGSHVLKGYGDFKDKMKYERLILGCKAGKERLTQSKGLRNSSTYKMGCPVKVNILRCQE